MRTTTILLICSVFAAGCGSDPPTSSQQLQQCNCSGATDSQGRCITGLGTTVATCTAGSTKPIGASTALNAPAGSTQAVSLGHMQVGTTKAFTVPPNTASITIVQQAVSPPDAVSAPPDALTYQLSSCTAPFQLDNTVVPLKVTDPNGQVVYNDLLDISSLDATALENLPAFFLSDSPVTGTLTIPNTHGALVSYASGLPAGQWSVTASDFGYECTLQQGGGATCSGGSTSSVYDVTVITKPLSAGAIPSSGTIDVAFYLATHLTGVSAKPLPNATTTDPNTDPDLKQLVSTLGILLGRAGITMNPPTWHELPASVQQAYATGVNVDGSGGCAPLPQLLTNSQPGNTFNVFLVSSFSASGLGPHLSIVGVDGTIPGPATVGGTVASGAAVSTADLRTGTCVLGTPNFASCGNDTTAYFIAHEAGHFMGLYHTTESQGTSFDVLADTSRCPCLSCATPPATKCADATPAPAAGTEHQMSVTECTASTACGGGDNLMFWLFAGGRSTGALTAEQGKVMRANPLVH
jgi:hypothetical protein